MFRILITEDEERYRYYLSRELEDEGNEVEVTKSGREAIEFGTRFRPDLLITDWMLNDHIHGIQVSKALQRVAPEMQTILITGFPSGDLKRQAERAGVKDFISKPFDLDLLRELVNKAKDKKSRGDVPDTTAKPILGLIEYDSKGRVSFINEKAKTLLGGTVKGTKPSDLSEIFTRETIQSLDKAEKEWQKVFPIAEDRVRWFARFRHDEQSNVNMLMLLGENEDFLVNDPAVRLIVDVISPQRYRWPFESRALVIDDEDMFREVIVAQLEISGCVCHAAGNYLEALRLLEADPGIKTVIFDYEMPDRFVPNLDISRMIGRMKNIRDDLIIVGNSGGDHREDFRKAGTDLFLFKPWRIDELIETVKRDADRRGVEL